MTQEKAKPLDVVTSNSSVGLHRLEKEKGRSEIMLQQSGFVMSCHGD